MSHMRKDYGGVALIVGLLVLVLVLLCSITGCAAGRSPAQSWDQENLKRNDHGCPTAIFVAPKGELVQCQEKMAGFTIVLHAPKMFDTLEQAAIAGFKAIATKPTAQYYEWGGEIIRTVDGKFAALDANTDFAGDHVNIQSNFGLVGVVVASYHTHPCLPDHYVEYFSPPDLIEPIFFHRIIFMGDFCTGNVHEFKPGDKPDAENPKAGDNRTLYLPKGRIVGQFKAPGAVIG